ISDYERSRGARKARQIPWKQRDHALFLAFAPVGAPRYVCATVVEHGGASGGGGSGVGAPICPDLLLAAPTGGAPPGVFPTTIRWLRRSRPRAERWPP